MTVCEIRPGFIGTGAIAEAVITGLLEHSGFVGPIHISERNQARSSSLSRRFDTIIIEEENQSIVNQCNWIFVSVLPEQAPAVLSTLDFDKEQILVSMVAGIGIQELGKLASPIGQVYRMIPLPPIAMGEGPLPVFPDNPQLIQLFANCGEVFTLDNEDQFSICSAASSLMATHHEIAATLAGWMNKKGLAPELSAKYATGFINALAIVEKNSTSDQLLKLAAESVTAGGLNEQVLRELHELDWFLEIERRLNRIAERLNTRTVDR